MSASASIFEISLLLAAFLCTVVFGITLIFGIVIMPGIALLENGAFLRAFQVIDGVIQRNQPVFVSVWIGSVVALLVATGFGMNELNGSWKAGLVLATVAYLGGQVSTFTINVPLNNRVKTLDIETMDKSAKLMERDHFETRWNRWNTFRTVSFGFVSVYLLVLLLLVDSGSGLRALQRESPVLLYNGPNMEKVMSEDL